MNLYSVLKFLHVLSVIMFVGGIFARQLVRSLAKKAEAVRVVAGLSRAAGRIDMVLVRSGSTVALAKGQASRGPRRKKVTSSPPTSPITKSQLPSRTGPLAQTDPCSTLTRANSLTRSKAPSFRRQSCPPYITQNSSGT